MEAPQLVVFRRMNTRLRYKSGYVGACAAHTVQEIPRWSHVSVQPYYTQVQHQRAGFMMEGTRFGRYGIKEAGVSPVE